MDAKYTHTNLVAIDWKKLANFYQQVFGCTPLLPERHLSGKMVEALTAVDGAQLDGIHLLLPGYGEHGPTLEIFQYRPEGEDVLRKINRPGFAHLAFAVEDVDAALEELLAAGGSLLGEVVTMQVAGKGKIRVAYGADPEGNAIELQCWFE